MRHQLIFVGVPVAAILTGCMNLSGLGGDSHYACKAPQGVACDSVSGNYANAGARLAAKTGPASLEPVSPTAPRTRRLETATAAKPTVAAQPESPDSTDSLPALRSTPRILRLWIKPWEDADRDLYDQSYVYLQVDNGRWLVEHAQRDIRSAYAPVRPPERLSSPQSSGDKSGSQPAASEIGRARGQSPTPMAASPSSAVDAAQ